MIRVRGVALLPVCNLIFMSHVSILLQFITTMFIQLCRTQSVTWNPHKLMGSILQCSSIHFKEDVSIQKIENRCSSCVID